jgi:uncharacterized protein YcgI (DUF1989 family)
VDEPRGGPVDEVEIPPDSGRHIRVAHGDILRLACPDGGQVADVCIFNAADPTEHLWANQTLLREGAHVTRGTRLWGTMPLYRPLATVITDTVSERVDPDETRHHIILGAHCTRYMWLIATGRPDHPNCYDQLCDGVDAAGIPRELIHDNVNFFQRTRLDASSDQYVTEASAVRPGDYVELYSEMDLVLAISACPMGSGRHRAETGQRDTQRLLATTYRSSHRPPKFSYPSPS